MMEGQTRGSASLTGELMGSPLSYPRMPDNTADAAERDYEQTKETGSGF